jgi:hypothetical protein
MYNAPKPDMFKELLPTGPKSLTEVKTPEDKAFRAYLRAKLRIARRTRRNKAGQTRWEPKILDKVLARQQPISDAAKGITAKFIPPYNGPWIISRIMPPSTYELSDSTGKIRGIFSKKDLKPFLTLNDDHKTA